MLITPWFSFLHVPKTGGSFVRRVLSDHLGDAVEATYHHEPWEQLPDRQLPVLCFVRNPWDWYVSWYHYLHQYHYGPGDHAELVKDPLYRSAFGAGKNDFRTTVRRACLGMIDVRQPEVERLMGELDADFYTARFRFIVGAGLDDERLTVGRYEYLLEDLTAFLARTQTPGQDALFAAVEHSPRERTSEHRHYRDYYDDELRDLVRTRSRWVIERFGYEF